MAQSDEGNHYHHAAAGLISNLWQYLLQYIVDNQQTYKLERRNALARCLLPAIVDLDVASYLTFSQEVWQSSASSILKQSYAGQDLTYSDSVQFDLTEWHNYLPRGQVVEQQFPVSIICRLQGCIYRPTILILTRFCRFPGFLKPGSGMLSSWAFKLVGWGSEVDHAKFASSKVN